MTIQTILGVIFIGIGLSALTGAPVFKIALGCLLVYAGVRVLSRGQMRDVQSVDGRDVLREIIIMSPFETRITSDHFRGGTMVVVGSGGTLDLTQAHAAGPIDIELISVCSGMYIIVPDNWQVTLDAATWLGGSANHARKEAEIHVRIRGVVVCGGVDIRHASR